MFNGKKRTEGNNPILQTVLLYYSYQFILFLLHISDFQKVIENFSHLSKPEIKKFKTEYKIN